MCTGENVIRYGQREVAKPLRVLNIMTEFGFLSEWEPLNNSESDVTVTFKSLCLKGHSCSSEEKAVEG